MSEMSLFEALPPDRRPIREADFAVDLISESEFADSFDPKVARKPKSFTVALSIKIYLMLSRMQFAADSRRDNARLRT
jgi:hypothetical protein